MQPALAPFKRASQKTNLPAPLSVTSSPLYGADEINAYIAIRDQLLAEAERTRTRAKFDSALIANNFVAGCLVPARSPYQMQSLSEAEASRQRKRCAAVKNRITELRASVA